MQVALMSSIQCLLLRVLALCYLVLVSQNSAADPDRTQVPALPFDADHAVSLRDNHTPVTLGRGMRFWASAGEHDGLEALRGVPVTRWQVNHSSILNLGYQRNDYWFVQDLVTADTLPTHWILEQANSMVDSQWVYLVRDGRLIQQWQAGDTLPFADRPIANARFLFPLQLEPASRYQIYLRVRNSEAMELPLLLTDAATHAGLREQRALVDGLFHGFLVIMAAYSLMLFLNLRDKTYLYYVAYVVSMLLFFLSQQGLLYQYVFPQWPKVQHYSAAWVSLLIFVSIAMFFREFLHLHLKLPLIWRIYLVLLVVHAGLCGALLALDYHDVIQLMALVAGVASILAAGAILRLAMDGSRSAQIVLVGWAFLITFVVLFVFAKIGIFYSEFLAGYGLRIGITLEILIFSFALSFRINEERKEKEWALNNINQERNERIRAQELALQREKEMNLAREETLQMEIRHRESLEHLVEERTADLERTLSNLAKANQELEQLSARDSLTGLHNRRHFNAKLNEQWQSLARKSEPLSILIIDIDHFKHINDSKGHLCGDYVLQTFAELLKSLLHRPCDVITRYGGEEFAILLPATPASGAAHVAELIVRAAAANVYTWENASFTVTVSIGANTCIPQAAETPQTWLASADSALYQAKQSGRNRWIQARAE